MLRKKFGKFTRNIWKTISKPALVFGTILFCALSARAQVLFENTTMYVGDTGEKTNFNAIISNLGPGKVVILSEQHGFEPHHQNQRDFLVGVFNLPFAISVGMEFFSYPDQELVDQYGNMVLNESDFLTRIAWGGLPFQHYRFQVRLPYFADGRTVALNLPRAITGKVSQSGLASLTPSERALLPPQLTLGNAEYRERFDEVMKGHVQDSVLLDNYFVSQSLWDETMAWRTAEYMKRHPDHLFLIIVGDFHVAYEDGLVERLRAYGLDPLVISQVTDESEVAPHARYGRRGDFVWLSR